MKVESSAGASTKPLVEFGGGPSNHFGFSTHFLAPLCAEIIELLESCYRGAELTVTSCNPPGAMTIDHGCIVLELNNGRSVVRIGANFGVSEKDGTPIRSGLDVNAWKLNSQDWKSANIWLATWEEAWVFICAIGKFLEVSTLRIGYGT